MGESATIAPPAAEAAAAGDWRIDDLAHKAGVSVDTIRYYQREGLLPTARRKGRAQALRPRPPRAPRAHPRAPGPPLLPRRHPGAAGGVGQRRGHLRRRARDPVLRSTSSPRTQGSPPSSSPGCAPSGSCPTPRRSAATRTTAPTSTCSTRWPSCSAPASPRTSSSRSPRSTPTGWSRSRKACSRCSRVSGGRSGIPRISPHSRPAARSTPPGLVPLVMRMVTYLHQRTLQRLTLGAIERRARPSSGP